jgi:hypothetical protein
MNNRTPGCVIEDVRSKMKKATNQREGNKMRMKTSVLAIAVLVIVGGIFMGATPALARGGHGGGGHGGGGGYSHGGGHGGYGHGGGHSWGIGYGGGYGGGYYPYYATPYYNSTPYYYPAPYYYAPTYAYPPYYGGTGFYYGQGRHGSSFGLASPGFSFFYH